MPSKPKHRCRKPGCANLVESGESFCVIHKPTIRDRFVPEYFRLYNNKRWRRYRRMFLNANPLCVNFEVCHNAAVVVDHIVDHKGDWDRFWDKNNHQPMCESCHNRKTAKEENMRRKNR